MCAFQLAAQVGDLLLRGAQAIEEFFLLILHQLGAFLQIAEHGGKIVDNGFPQCAEALAKALLVVLAADYAA